jgi:hypothetical protein
MKATGEIVMGTLVYPVSHPQRNRISDEGLVVPQLEPQPARVIPLRHICSRNLRFLESKGFLRHTDVSTLSREQLIEYMSAKNSK